MYTRLNPNKHYVRETEVSRHFCRDTGCPDWITFWNQDLGEWVLGVWADREHRLIEEIEDLGPNFEKLTQDLAQRIRACWRPDGVNWKNHKDALKGKARAEQRAADEKCMERQEEWDWMKKKIDGRAPVPFMMNAT